MEGGFFILKSEFKIGKKILLAVNSVRIRMKSIKEHADRTSIWIISTDGNSCLFWFVFLFFVFGQAMTVEACVIGFAHSLPVHSRLL